MSNIKTSITQIIGNTPLLQLNNYINKHNLCANILAKLECLNPAGSVKDRVAFSMIKDAEEKGILKEGSTIIEPTSGNTGIGIASVSTAKGYKTILTMPETMSIERRRLLKAYGAEIVLTDGSKGMSGAIAKANELAQEIPNSIVLGQFENQANPEIHYNTTGAEIWNDTDHKVDILVAGIGTGGTISGVGKFLKEKNPDIKIIGIEPADSPVLTEGKAGPHKIQGIGAGFVPKTLSTDIYDEVFTVSNDEAFEYAIDIAKTEGVLVGISSGAALSVATNLASKEENKGKNIVVIFPDNGDRYFSTPLFAD